MDPLLPGRARCGRSANGRRRPEDSGRFAGGVSRRRFNRRADPLPGGPPARHRCGAPLPGSALPRGRRRAPGRNVAGGGHLAFFNCRGIAQTHCRREGKRPHQCAANHGHGESGGIVLPAIAFPVARSARGRGPGDGPGAGIRAGLDSCRRTANELWPDGPGARGPGARAAAFTASRARFRLARIRAGAARPHAGGGAVLQ